MATNPHPVVAPYTARSAADLIAFVKLRDRLSVADNAEIRNTDFSDQFGGLYVRATRKRYDLDTESTSEDDDDSFIVDGSGAVFVKVNEGTETVARLYTDADVVAGAITIEDSTDRALINVTSAVTINIPAAASRGVRDLLIKDVGGQAGAHNLLPAFDGVEQCDGMAGAAFTIGTNYGWLQIAPKTGGYYTMGSQL
jgi:hypothetical protein